VKEQTLSNKSTLFNIDVNSFIENRENLSNLKIEKIYHNQNHTMLNYSDWKILENEHYQKLYNKIKFRKDDRKPCLALDLNISQKSHSNGKSKSSKNVDESDILKFEFLGDKIKPNQYHIVNKFNHLLSKDHLIFNWSAEGKDGNIITGVTFHECKLKIPSINKIFLKTIFKNSSEIKITQHKMSDSEETLVIVDINFNRKGYQEISDISWYEIYISDEENDFMWMGLKKFKVTNQPTGPAVLKLQFSFMTNKSGTCEINKINITLYPKGQNEKPIVISGIPYPIIIDVL
jgi:hypothetical protein